VYNGCEGIWECADGLRIRVEGLRKFSRKVCHCMYLYSHAARHYEGKERLAKLCLLRLGLHHLKSCHQGGLFLLHPLQCSNKR
jgi:hypothetical protein